MDLEEIKGVHWMTLAKDWYEWRAVVSTMMNFWVS
jgi:hypothetical protein